MYSVAVGQSPLLELAERVFAPVEELLGELEGLPYVDWAIARLAATRLRFAKEVLQEHTASARDLWGLRLEATGRTPRTVCLGKTRRRLEPDDAQTLGVAELPIAPDGCGHVVPDSRRVVHLTYCDSCRRRETDRQRAFERDARALVVDGKIRSICLDPSGSGVGYFYDSRCACGTGFLARRPDERACPSCRTAHRQRNRSG